MEDGEREITGRKMTKFSVPCVSIITQTITNAKRMGDLYSLL